MLLLWSLVWPTGLEFSKDFSCAVPVDVASSEVNHVSLVSIRIRWMVACACCRMSDPYSTIGIRACLGGDGFVTDFPANEF